MNTVQRSCLSMVQCNLKLEKSHCTILEDTKRAFNRFLCVSSYHQSFTALILYQQHLRLKDDQLPHVTEYVFQRLINTDLLFQQKLCFESLLTLRKWVSLKKPQAIKKLKSIQLYYRTMLGRDLLGCFKLNSRVSAAKNDEVSAIFCSFHLQRGKAMYLRWNLFSGSQEDTAYKADQYQYASLRVTEFK